MIAWSDWAQLWGAAIGAGCVLGALVAVVNSWRA